MTVPVSIRTKNPGAMWPGAIATKFGSVSHENLRDGNKAAVFPTFEQGAAAQFALWAGSGYAGKSLGEAIKKWSGGNSSPAYAAFLQKRIPGLSMNTIITRAFLAGVQGRAFMAAQAQWEAGQPYPMTDAQWAKAQQIAFGSAAPPVAPAKPTATPGQKTAAGAATGAVVAAGAGATAAANQGVSALEILAWIGGLTAIAIIVFIVCFRLIKGIWPWTGKASQAPSPPSPLSSDQSLALVSAQLALSSAASQATPSRKSSVLNRRRKQLAKPSQKTQARRTNLRKQNPSAGRKSSRKRKSKSKG